MIVFKSNRQIFFDLLIHPIATHVIVPTCTLLRAPSTRGSLNLQPLSLGEQALIFLVPQNGEDILQTLVREIKNSLKYSSIICFFCISKMQRLVLQNLSDLEVWYLQSTDFPWGPVGRNLRAPAEYAGLLFHQANMHMGTRVGATPVICDGS